MAAKLKVFTVCDLAPSPLAGSTVNQRYTIATGGHDEGGRSFYRRLYVCLSVFPYDISILL